MRYGLKRRLRRGIRLKIFLTFKCTLDCYYCGNKLGGDTKPKDRGNKTWQEWKEYIMEYPEQINEVFLTGGEPTILLGFQHLVNWLTENDYLVTVYTNLTNHRKWASVNKSSNIRIQATFHGRVDNIHRFMMAYKEVSKRHRVDVEEIAENRLPFSKRKEWGCTVDLAKQVDKGYYRVSPDGEQFDSCYGVLKHNGV